MSSARAALSVVRLQYARAFVGTGFVVHTSPEAFLVMTCEHVVANRQSIQVSFPGETERYSARIVGIERDIDLALLKFTPDEHCRQCVPLRFAALDTPVNCGQVQMIGYHQVPNGQLLNPGVFDGSIIGEPAAGHISCDYVSDYGTSGSPVLKGNMVVGVNSGIEFGGIRNAIPVVDVCASLRLWSRIGEAINGLAKA